jgi:hypothetical protein
LGIDQNPYQLGGFVGMGVAAVANSMRSPDKKSHNPLTIYKNDFMSQIIAKNQ